jgi:AraC-like DNA-binding protein
LVQPILHAQVVCDPAPVDTRRDADRLDQWVTDLRNKREDRREIVFLEVHARLKRLAMALSATPSRAPADRKRARGTPVEEAVLSKAEQMACFIAQHYVDPLSVDEIAASVGLHPNYAMNLFRRVFRTTINAYLTRHRISHAQRLLVTGDQKILAIALDSGFGSISRFNDAFRRECGCSPRAYRAEHRL